MEDDGPYCVVAIRTESKRIRADIWASNDDSAHKAPMRFWIAWILASHSALPSRALARGGGSTTYGDREACGSCVRLDGCVARRTPKMIACGRRRTRRGK